MTNPRITRDQLWMDIAHIVSKRSTCYRANVGAVIVKDTSILSIGYNGPPSGDDHCNGIDCCSQTNGCHRAIHAEINAINRASGSTIGSKLYCTTSPCENCSRHISLHGIAAVFYVHAYRDFQPVYYLDASGVEVYRMSPNGMLINPFTNELLT